LELEVIYSNELIKVLIFPRFWERCYNKCDLYFNIDFFLLKLVISNWDVTRVAASGKVRSCMDHTCWTMGGEVHRV